MEHWNKTERRKPVRERRDSSERRFEVERRFDFRQAVSPARRSVKSWIRSLTNARLGVDRRKIERRIVDRRSEELRSLLTPEEIADLLK